MFLKSMGVGGGGSLLLFVLLLLFDYPELIVLSSKEERLKKDVLEAAHFNSHALKIIITIIIIFLSQ